MKLRALFLLPLLFLLIPVAASAAAPRCTLEALPASIIKGQSFTLRWKSVDATSGAITGIKSAIPLNGSINLIPVRSTRFIGTFNGPGGKAVCEAIISVQVEGTFGSVFNAEGESGMTVLSPGILIEDSNGQLSSPGSVSAPGGISDPNEPLGSPGSLTAPDTLAPPASLQGAPSSGSAPTLPTANNITLSNNPGTGIVPCTGINCQACDLAKLGQRIINFLIGLSIPLAAALFAYAGFLYFTSSVQDKLAKARKIFSSVAIGFALVFAGFLVVETILHTILDEDYFKSWNQIECIKTADNTTGGRQLNKDIKDLLSVLPFLNTAPQPQVVTLGVYQDSPVNPQTGCDLGDFKQGDGSCLGSFGQTYTPDSNNTRGTTASAYGASAGLGGTQQYAAQLESICSQYQGSFADCAHTSQAIMAIESGGRPAIISSAGAVGLMQVMPATACGLDPGIQGCSTGNYSAVTQALQDPQRNMQLGVQYLNQMRNQFSNDDQFIAAYNGGPRANTASVTCPGQTYWECSANGGYTETRKYVPKFQAARSLL